MEKDVVRLCCLLEPIPESIPVEAVPVLNGLSESLEESKDGSRCCIESLSVICFDHFERT